MRLSPHAGSKPSRNTAILAVSTSAFLLLNGLTATRSQADEPRGGEWDTSSEVASSSISSPDPVLSAIELLESDRDATCHSSASRFEDFLYGTPLSDEAREAKTELQKQLLKRVWQEASRTAARSGDDTVSAERLRPQIEALLESDEDSDGNLRVTFPGREPLILPKTRVRQYGSISYSLRVILAAQQDFLLSGGEPLLTLTEEAIDLLRQFLDSVTLSVLMVADQNARERNEFQITADQMQTAWQELVVDLPDLPPLDPAEDPSLGLAAAGSRTQGLALLNELFDKKTAAYRAYNDLDKDDIHKLLVTNIYRFYARASLPRDKETRFEIVAALKSELDDFGVALLVDADRRARAAGRTIIRANDASAAVQQLIPHQIDEFEDVHVFPRFEAERRITLESYDCDSFRDLGIHWRSLKRAIPRLPEDAALPDPFAAEILAEAISQYGVLLLRIAGEVAVQTNDTVRLQSGDLPISAAKIDERARRHPNAPALREIPSQIRSAQSNPGTQSGDASTRFFTDVTAAAGIDFTHRSSRWLAEYRRKLLDTPPTFSGGGVAAEDLNGDSYMDLLFVGGGGNAVLINDGRGRYRDVTEQSGIVLKRPDGSHGEARMPVIADFDNDGRQDILITYVDDDQRLFRNLGGMKFEDVSSKSGLGGKGRIAGPATVFDFDQDGLLDIYVTNFGDYLNGEMPALGRDNRNALPNQLFRNLGGMRFEDVTEGSGTADTGWTQAVSHVDFDRDGRQDLIVANDFGRNAFLRNLGDGRFEDVAPALGVTKAFHSMNVGFSDLNGDGYPDIYISNIATLVKDNKYIFPDVNTPMNFDLRAMSGMMVQESDKLYMSHLNEGRLAYTPSEDIERGATTTGWAWDAEFLDFDHDGDDDLYLVNGTNDYNAYSMVFKRDQDDPNSKEMMLTHTRESNVFFLNHDGKLKNVSGQSGADFTVNSRSTAYLDIDEDGDLDIAINNFHSPAILIRNDSDKEDRGWLKIRLIGDPERGSNRDAIGARILLTADDGLRVLREIHGGSGYMSMNPKQLHFGLDSAASVHLKITWPNGEQQELESVAANRSYIIRQGETIETQSARRLSGVENSTATP
jgi:hypothetical protein